MATIKIRRAQQTLEIPNVDLSGTVAQLKTLIAGATSIQSGSQRLVFGGRVLEDANTLTSYGIAAGATLHMVVKDAAPAATPAVPVAPAPVAASDAPISPLSAAPAHPAASPELRAFLQTVAASPDGQMMLAAALQNPALLMELARQNPALGGIIQEVMANPAVLAEVFQQPQRAPGEPFVSREIFNVAIRCLNGEPVPEEYQLDEDEEEGEAMDVSGDDSHGSEQGGAPVAVGHEYISRAQVAHAIAYAQGRAGPVAPPSAAPARGPSAPAPARAPAAPGAPRPAAPPAGGNPTEAARQRFGPQLAQLTAMGFPEEMCLRALEMANGDVNSAIAILLG